MSAVGGEGSRKRFRSSEKCLHGPETGNGRRPTICRTRLHNRLRWITFRSHAERHIKRTTIKDIARALGVAPSTVSRALADHPDLSADTKQRVRDVAAALRYVPDLRARRFRERHSHLVALIVPEVNMFFVPSLMSGIQDVLEAAGYALLVFQSNDAFDRESALVALCVHLGVDGVLLARSAETTHLDHLDALAAADIPVVLLDKILDTDRVSTVSIDDLATARDATGYLLDRGHRRVAGVFSDTRQRIGALRRAGFLAAFAERGLPADDALVVEVASLDAFADALAPALDAAPTALFAMSDELLVRAHHAVLARGLRIPDDVSLVAISDGQAPHFLHPPVTHWLHAGQHVGAEAAHVLLRAVGQEDAAVVEVRLQTRLVELGSVRPAGAGPA